MTRGKKQVRAAIRAAFTFLLLAAMSSMPDDNGDVDFSINTKIYLEADGSVNVPRYSGYRLTYEKDRRTVVIMGTFYPPGTPVLNGNAAENLALRIWQASSGSNPPNLLTLCCAPGSGPQNVQVADSDKTLQILDFFGPTGQKLYREIRQIALPSLTLTLGLNSSKDNQQLRAIAVSSDRFVDKKEFQRVICETRREYTLKSPEITGLQKALGSDSQLLDIIIEAC